MPVIISTLVAIGFRVAFVIRRARKTRPPGDGAAAPAPGRQKAPAVGARRTRFSPPRKDAA
jgi:hypothetical protein